MPQPMPCRTMKRSTTGRSIIKICGEPWEWGVKPTGIQHHRDFPPIPSQCFRNYGPHSVRGNCCQESATSPAHHQPNDGGGRVHDRDTSQRPSRGGTNRRGWSEHDSCRAANVSRRGPADGEGENTSEMIPTKSKGRLRQPRLTRRPVPREERLTDEDWAIMTAVENCIVYRTLRAFNLKQWEKLLAAIRMTFRESIEGNSHHSTVGCPQDFIDWGRHWGTDEMEAQVVLQNQWDDILHHIMGITAAMEVWKIHSGTVTQQHHRLQKGENRSGGEPTGASCSDEGDEDRGEAEPADQPQKGHGAAEGEADATMPLNKPQRRGRPMSSWKCLRSTTERRCHSYEADHFMQLGA